MTTKDTTQEDTAAYIDRLNKDPGFLERELAKLEQNMNWPFMGQIAMSAFNKLTSAVPADKRIGLSEHYLLLQSILYTLSLEPPTSDPRLFFTRMLDYLEQVEVHMKNETYAPHTGRREEG